VLVLPVHGRDLPDEVADRHDQRRDPRGLVLEPLRALTVSRRSAVKAQHAAWRQIGAILINAPTHIRDHYRDLSDTKVVAALASTRPSQVTDQDDADTLHALRSLARRHRDLTEEITTLKERLGARATAANPALLAIKGVGPVTGAQLLITAGDNPDRLRSSASFAALCGTAPIPVSSGRTDRHRLSRGGDRAANAALYHVVNVRMSSDSRTRAYRDAHLAKGWTKKAIYPVTQTSRRPGDLPSPPSAAPRSRTTATSDPPGKPRT